LALRENSHFGPYLITGTLGKGGMASVYRAYETDLDRSAAPGRRPGLND
jgi:serine/threonine protein kinase